MQYDWAGPWNRDGETVEAENEGKEGMIENLGRRKNGSESLNQSPEKMKLKQLEGLLGGLQQFPQPKVNLSPFSQTFHHLTSFSEYDYHINMGHLLLPCLWLWLVACRWSLNSIQRDPILLPECFSLCSLIPFIHHPFLFHAPFNLYSSNVLKLDSFALYHVHLALVVNGFF